MSTCTYVTSTKSDDARSVTLAVSLIYQIAGDEKNTIIIEIGNPVSTCVGTLIGHGQTYLPLVRCLLDSGTFVSWQDSTLIAEAGGYLPTLGR